ncbi:MAG: hypothetical protein HGA38_03785 [Candidatus Moranbacteria bacterium]|nr:hypothetical protein [Candidatus Moranbacteria bacterium]
MDDIFQCMKHAPKICDLTEIPGVGKSIAEDLRKIGVRRVANLRGGGEFLGRFVIDRLSKFIYYRDNFSKILID